MWEYYNYKTNSYSYKRGVEEIRGKQFMLSWTIPYKILLTKENNNENKRCHNNKEINNVEQSVIIRSTMYEYTQYNNLYNNMVTMTTMVTWIPSMQIQKWTRWGRQHQKEDGLLHGTEELWGNRERCLQH